MWGAWIEITDCSILMTPPESLPVWGAWIEIYGSQAYCTLLIVAPRVGGVD